MTARVNAAIASLLDAVETPLAPRLAAALRRLVAAGALNGSPGGFSAGRASLSLFEGRRLEAQRLAIVARPEGAPWSAASIRPSAAGIAWVRARDGATAAPARTEAASWMN